MLARLGTEAMFWIAFSSFLSFLTGLGFGVYVADRWPKKDQAG
jgi:hypothetical protein